VRCFVINQIAANFLSEDLRSNAEIGLKVLDDSTRRHAQDLISPPRVADSIGEPSK
jgi:hypothetical protein